MAPSQAGTLSAIREGLAYVLHDLPLRMVMILVAMINLCLLGPITVGIPYLARERMGTPTAYGVIVTAGAVGALIGMFAGGFWKVRRRGAVILASSAMVAAGLICIPFVPGIAGIAAVRFVMAVAGSLATLHIFASIMERTDSAMRGRVTSVLMLCALGMAPISTPVAGFIAAWSITGLFLLSGVCLALVTAGITFQRGVRDIA